MIKSRYQTAPNTFNYRGVPRIGGMLRRMMNNGEVPYTERILQDGERLDTVAGEVYGDSRYWWIIAAASRIGWGMQLPPGTILYVPSLPAVMRYL